MKLSFDKTKLKTNNNILNIDSCDSKIGLNKLYESRLSIREAICKKYNINCHSFLQPMAGVHGVQIDSLLSKKRKILQNSHFVGSA